MVERRFFKENVKKCKIIYNIDPNFFSCHIRSRGKILLTLPLTLLSLALVKLKGLSIFQLFSLFRLIKTLRRSGRFSFNQSQNNNSNTLSVSEAYKILNLDINKKPTMESINQAYIKIQKKIHPDISPETTRLSAIVNEAKEIVIKDIS